MVTEEYADLLPWGQEVLTPCPKGSLREASIGQEPDACCDPAVSDPTRSGRPSHVLVWCGTVLRSVIGLGLIMVGLSACAPGEDPPPPLPAELLGFLGTTEFQVTPSGPGFAYYRIRNEAEPWAVHLLRVEVNRCELGLRVLEAPVGGGEESGWSPVTELLASQGGTTLAAVNGDFFTPEGLPVGTEVVGGTTRRIRDRPAFAWRPEDDPWMGMPGRRGDSILVLGWEVSRSRSDSETEVIGGFPLLLLDGLRVGDLEVAERASFAGERHPRTALGFDKETGLFWVAVVDGRQPGHSMGMTLPELTTLFEALGVDEAINLDGGGSSVMVVGGTTVSSPSDAEGERPVVNALGIRRDSTLCRPRS